MNPEDPVGFLPPPLQKIALDDDGNQRLDFCNLDGTVSDVDCPDISGTIYE